MGSKGWIVVLILATVSGWGILAYQYYTTKDRLAQVQAQIQVEVQTIVAQRDSIDATKQITLEQIKTNAAELNTLIRQMEKVKATQVDAATVKQYLQNL